MKAMAGQTGVRSEARFRVRYAETDQMGIVHHANYLVWMEVARTELCRLRGISYREMEERSGLHLVVAEVRCRYVQPARYDDEIVASAWIGRAHPRMVEFGYEIRRAGDGALLATGETRHLFVRDGKPVKIPEEFRPIFGIS
ncbi:MAG: acyl-CoA thioester hydrolase [Bryobacteraceae bacterium]|nr:MAG: acyl-CoA thioester hydrolase [Bryobacteraceae bacterium]